MCDMDSRSLWHVAHYIDLTKVNKFCHLKIYFFSSKDRDSFKWETLEILQYIDKSGSKLTIWTNSKTQTYLHMRASRCHYEKHSENKLISFNKKQFFSSNFFSIAVQQKLLSSSSSSSSCRAAGTDIPDPISPLLPIIHRLWKVFRVTSRILT